MKQTTTTEQTFTLIKLGFDKPKHFIEGPTFLDSGFAYTIGELIEMLPKYTEIKSQQCYLGIYPTKNKWYVFYENIVFKSLTKSSEIELIDALYDMILKLKEEGVV